MSHLLSPHHLLAAKMRFFFEATFVLSGLQEKEKKMGIDEPVSCRRLFGEQITALFVPKMSFSCYYSAKSIYLHFVFILLKNKEEKTVDSIKLM